MKYLVLHKRTVGATQPADPTATWKAVQAWLDSIGVQLESVYWMSGNGAMAILDVETNEELSALLQGNPMKPMGSYEIYPLSDINEFINGQLGGGMPQGFDEGI